MKQQPEEAPLHLWLAVIFLALAPYAIAGGIALWNSAP